LIVIGAAVTETMRPFEMLIVGLLVLGGLWSLVRGSRGRAVLFLCCGLGILALIGHVVFEGMHWQMAPAYLGVLIFAAVLLPARRRLSRIAGASGMLLLAVASCVFSAILPMFPLPRPTGSLAIGTRVMYLADPSRVEDAPGSGGGKRELMIQAWYPAEASRQPYAAYRRRIETTRLSSYQSVLWTHSRWEAPVAQRGDAFPVILFNPSWNGRRTQNTFLAEELASHGFVVVGIDHTYNSGPVGFPDGRVVDFVHTRDMEDFGSSSLERVNAIGDKEVEKEAADDVFVLNQLEEMNGEPASPFYRRLDTNNAGAFGHSFGGSASAEASYRDARIRSVLDMDGSIFGEVREKGLNKPFLFMTGDVELCTPAELDKLNKADRIDAEIYITDMAMFRKYGGYRIFLHGTSHEAFTDRALFSPLRSLSGAGTLDPRQEVFILRQYVLAFFEKTLRHEDPPLLRSAKSPFAEISMQIDPPSVDGETTMGAGAK
jgi:predicted dienelactone hydrolase